MMAGVALTDAARARLDAEIAAIMKASAEALVARWRAQDGARGWGSTNPIFTAKQPSGFEAEGKARFEEE